MQIIRLFVDEREIDINQETTISINIGIASLEDPGKTIVAYTKTVVVPITDNNRIALGFIEQVQSIEFFNNEKHKAMLTVDGNTTMQGSIILNNINLLKKEYSFNIIGSEIDWIGSAKNNINELPSDYTVPYNLHAVKANAMISHTKSPLIRFIPINKGAFYVNDANDKLIPRTYLVIEDFYPFINIWECLKLIFKDYVIDCPVKDKMKRMYFAGRVVESEDKQLIIENNDFQAGVYEERVIQVTQYNNSFEQSMVFDSIMPGENPDLFDNGVIIINKNEFAGQRGALWFSPKDDLVIKFDVEIKFSYYVPNYYDGLISGEYFKRVPIPINLAITVNNNKYDNYPIDFDLSNTISHSIGIQYPYAANMYIYIKLKTQDIKYIYLSTNPFEGDSDRSKRYIQTDGSHKPYVFTISNETKYFRIRLITFDNKEIASDPDKIYADFFVGDGCEITSTIKFSTTQYSYKKESHNTLWANFAASTGQMGIRVDISSTIAPNFSSMIGIDDYVGMSVVGGAVKQLDLIKSVRQMFNMLFYTNSEQKRITMSPYPLFYKKDIVDWTNRLVEDKEIIISELGNEMGAALKLKYQEGGDVIKAIEFKNKMIAGQEVLPLENKIKSEATTLENNLFVPSITTKDSDLVYAPKLAGDKDKKVIEDVDFNIEPLILEVLENTDTNIQADYRFPIAAFQDFGANVGFSNTSKFGLAQYYNFSSQYYNEGKSIVAYMAVRPSEIDMILNPDETGCNLMSEYNIKINGEVLTCKLQSISDYNPQNNIAKCTFYFISNYIERRFDIPDADYISPDKFDEIVFDNIADSKIISFETNKDWVIEKTYNSFLAFSIEAGTAGKKNISISTPFYGGIIDRTEQFSIKAGIAVVTVSVRQKRVPITLNISPSSISLSNAAARSYIQIRSNDKWTIYNSSYWIKLGQTSGSGDTTVYFDVTASNIGSYRNSDIVIKSGDITRRVNVTQDAMTNPNLNSNVEIEVWNEFADTMYDELVQIHNASMQLVTHDFTDEAGVVRFSLPKGGYTATAGGSGASSTFTVSGYGDDVYFIISPETE